METPAIPDKDRLKATNILRDTLTRNLDLSRSKPSFVLVLLPEASRAIYSALKALCDRELGVQTLCMLLDQATSLRKQNLPEGKKRALQKQYFANVVLKLNAKLGGENHSLDGASLRWFKEKRTMLVGIDVTHPSSTSAQGAPSIAAVVANTDDKLTQFPASLSLQVNRKIKKDAEEMVQDLRDMLIERLKLYKKTCHALPERVIVYRDGVSEGQYSLVLDKEVPQILEAFDSKELQFESKPTLSVIVCGKRHHARFLGTNKDEVTSNGNTRPGTVVDKGVTDIYNFDFYLQSHSGLKGTVRPTHYIVIYDENRISADEVQSAVHNNSHMYARATKAVSLVPPAYYADIACERARLYLGPLMDGTHPQSSKKTGKKSGEEERLRIFEEAKALWNAHGIHPDLQDTMFYI
ncbi:hypothetical protein NM688_g7779 [Phlebia brevispora]|uniref:Uncharacterized protein n=1 Tax=Phlebia brevispora TaxID=194682 RepID=A0ACC1S1F0_9APHY|nr:hypothetical protein NM688_g7779 [Phlebia brevispora]